MHIVFTKWTKRAYVTIHGNADNAPDVEKKLRKVLAQWRGFITNEGWRDAEQQKEADIATNSVWWIRKFWWPLDPRVKVSSSKKDAVGETLKPEVKTEAGDTEYRKTLISLLENFETPIGEEWDSLCETMVVGLEAHLSDYPDAKLLLTSLVTKFFASKTSSDPAASSSWTKLEGDPE